MTMYYTNESSIIEFYGSDQEYFCVHGEGFGEQGIYLASQQVSGLFDAPVKTEWKSSAFQIGGKPKHTAYLIRDISLGFHAIGTEKRSAIQNESDLRKMFVYEEDEWDDDFVLPRIDWTTTESGTRSLDVLLGEQPDVKMDLEPRSLEDKGYMNPVLPLKAGQPMWYEEPHIETFTGGGTSGSGFVAVSNPTDRPMYLKWVGTRAQWTLPDVSWRGRKYKRRPAGQYPTRSIVLPQITSTEGGVVVDVDPMEIMVRDANNHNMLPRMPVPGMYFMHVIPPYTPTTLLPVSYSGAPPGGAMMQCIQRRLWSRPWGLE